MGKASITNPAIISVLIGISFTLVVFQNCAKNFEVATSIEEISVANFNSAELRSLGFSAYEGLQSISGSTSGLQLTLAPDWANANPSSVDTVVDNLSGACAKLSAVANIECEVLDRIPTSADFNVIVVSNCAAGVLGGTISANYASIGFNQSKALSNSDINNYAFIRLCSSAVERDSLTFLLRQIGIGDLYRKTYRDKVLEVSQSYLDAGKVVPGGDSGFDQALDQGQPNLDSANNLGIGVKGTPRAVNTPFVIRESLQELNARHLNRIFLDGSSAQRVYPSLYDAAILRALYGAPKQGGNSCTIKVLDQGIESSITLDHGTSTGFYIDGKYKDGEGCKHEFRTCSNGQVSGSARFIRCAKEVASTTPPPPPPPVTTPGTSPGSCLPYSGPASCQVKQVCPSGKVVYDKVENFFVKSNITGTSGQDSYFKRVNMNLSDASYVLERWDDTLMRCNSTGAWSHVSGGNCIVKQTLAASDSRCVSATQPPATSGSCKVQVVNSGTYYYDSTLNQSTEVINYTVESLDEVSITMNIANKGIYTFPFSKYSNGNTTVGVGTHSFSFKAKKSDGTIYNCTPESTSITVVDAVGGIKGYVDSATKLSDGSVRVEGWACAQKFSSEITVGVHIFNASGGTSYTIFGKANIPREAAVASACSTAEAYHGFSVVIPKAQVDLHAGKAVNVLGLHPNSTGSKNAYLGNSGVLKLPEASVAAPPPAVVQCKPITGAALCNIKKVCPSGKFISEVQGNFTLKSDVTGTAGQNSYFRSENMSVLDSNAQILRWDDLLMKCDANGNWSVVSGGYCSVQQVVQDSDPNCLSDN